MRDLGDVGRYTQICVANLWFIWGVEGFRKPVRGLQLRKLKNTNPKRSADPLGPKRRHRKKLTNKKSILGCFRAKLSKRGPARHKKDFERRSQIKISPYGAEVMTDLRNYVDKTGFLRYVNFLANMVIGQKIWQPPEKKSSPGNQTVASFKPRHRQNTHIT